MARKTPLKNVMCKVNDNLSIIVSNTREVYGHDDSLPFNAEIFICKDGVTEQIATAWNDGWGDETNIDALADKQEVVKSLEEQMRTYKYQFMGREFNASLPMVVELLANAAVFRAYSCITIEDLLKE